MSAEALLILKVLDLAALGFKHYQAHQESQAERDKIAAEISGIRLMVMAGELDDDQAAAKIEAISQEISARRRKSFADLPKPVGA